MSTAVDIPDLTGGSGHWSIGLVQNVENAERLIGPALAEKEATELLRVPGSGFVGPLTNGEQFGAALGSPRDLDGDGVDEVLATVFLGKLLVWSTVDGINFDPPVEFDVSGEATPVELAAGDGLKRIDAVANDLDLRTSVASPTFRVSAMTLAGR